MSKTVEVTFEIDDDLYEQVKLFCEEHKITVEERKDYECNNHERIIRNNTNRHTV